MKKLLVLFALVGLFLVGCQDSGDVGIAGPDNSNTISKSQSSLNIEGSLDNIVVSPSVTKAIDGKKGDTITLNASRVGINGLQTVSVELSIGPNSFDGIKDITVNADFDNASVSFYPHMTFNTSGIVKLDAKFTGINLDLFDITSGKKINFYFFDDNGGTELIKNNGIGVETIIGSVSVKSAQLYHFSRYGWAT